MSKVYTYRCKMCGIIKDHKISAVGQAGTNKTWLMCNYCGGKVSKIEFKEESK